MILRIVRQLSRRHFTSYVDKTKRMVETFQAKDIKQTLKTLDYLYTNREYMKSQSKELYIVAQKVYSLIEGQRADINVIRIYDNLMALKINTQEIRNIIAKKIKDRLKDGRFGIQQLELAYFVVTRLPYHSIQEQLSTMTIKMHEYKIAVTSVKSYLAYSKLAVLLKYIGFEMALPKWQKQYKMEEITKEDILSLVYNISVLQPDNAQLIYRLLEMYQLADEIARDQYLHKIEYIESDEGENKAQEVYDIVNWYDIALLCRMASMVELQQQQQFKIVQLVQRKFETENIDVYSAVDVIRFGVKTQAASGKDIVSKCLESIREIDQEIMTTIPLRSIAQLFRLVKQHDINQQFIDMFMESIPKNRLEYDQETMRMLREVLNDRKIDQKLKKFIQQQ